MEKIKQLNEWLEDFFDGNFLFINFNHPSKYTIYVDPKYKEIKLSLFYGCGRLEISATLEFVDLKAIVKNSDEEEVVMCMFIKEGKHFSEFLDLVLELLDIEE